jgi:hypothetical protein
MTAKPRKTLLVNLTWTAVLVAGLYVTAWIVLPYTMYRWGFPRYATWDTVEPVFAPLDRYCGSDLPGAMSLREWYIRRQWRALAARDREWN